MESEKNDDGAGEAGEDEVKAINDVINDAGAEPEPLAPPLQDEEPVVVEEQVTADRGSRK